MLPRCNSPLMSSSIGPANGLLIVISREKTEALLFTNWANEAGGKCVVDLELNPGEKIKQVQSLRFLGITLDERLTFAHHVKKTFQNVLARQRAITILATTDFGADEATVRASHRCITEPAIDYGAGIYASHAAPSTLEKLEVVQRAAGRIITGLPKGTRDAVVYAESQLLPNMARARSKAALLHQRMLRLPPHHPSFRISQPLTKSRLTRKSWRSTAIDVANTAEVPTSSHNIEPFSFISQPPWTFNSVNVFYNMDAVKFSSKTDTPDLRRAASIDVLLSLPPNEYVYWTDGSVVDGTGRGGGGIFIWDPGGPQHQHSWSVPAGRLCSSFRAEMTALKAALTHATSHDHPHLRVCTDSLSAIQGLQEGPSRQSAKLGQQIWTLLSELSSKGRSVRLVWVPGHAGLTGNERADRTANEGVHLPQDATPLDFQTAKAAIKRSCITTARAFIYSTVPPDHFHRRATDGKPSSLPPHTSRKLSNAVHQLRANNSYRLPHTLHRWRRPGATGRCQFCGAIDADANHLLLFCPQWTAQRTLAGITNLSILQKPEALNDFLKSIGWWQHRPDMTT